MTPDKLQTIEAELQRRGYHKWTTDLTSTETYAWFKSFGKEKDEDGDVVDGYQVAFRVWDWSKYTPAGFGLDFWTSAIGTDNRMDFTANWEPICDIDTFERMAAEFNQMVREFVKE